MVSQSLRLVRKLSKGRRVSYTLGSLGRHS